MRLRLPIFPAEPPPASHASGAAGAPAAAHGPVPVAGCSLVRLDRRHTDLVAELVAAPGDGEAPVSLRLQLRAGAAHGDITALPLAVERGAIAVPGEPATDALCAPWPHAGAVEIELVGADGRRVLMVGAALVVEALGTAGRGARP